LILKIRSTPALIIVVHVSEIATVTGKYITKANKKAIMAAKQKAGTKTVEFRLRVAVK